MAEQTVQTITPGALVIIGGDRRAEVIGQTSGEHGPMAVIQPFAESLEGKPDGLHQILPLDLLAESANEGPFNREYRFSEYMAECRAWNRLCGKNMEIPYPPSRLVQTLEYARKIGLNRFEAHYLPSLKLERDGMRINSVQVPYPVTRQKPPDWLFDDLDKRELAKLEGSTYSSIWNPNLLQNFNGGWVLLDATPKPDLILTQPDTPYPDDPLVPLLQEAADYAKSKIKFPDPRNRRGISYDTLREFVLPLLDIRLKNQRFGIPRFKTTLPYYSEFVVLGNLFHREWELTTGSELVEDMTYGGGRCVSGGAGSGGFSEIFQMQSGSGLASVGFRPIIRFSEYL